MVPSLYRKGEDDSSFFYSEEKIPLRSKRSVRRSWMMRMRGQGKLYDNQYVGDYLAKHGYVVFSADAPMWGERGRKEGVDRNKYDLIAGNMMMLGRDLSAFMTYDDISSTEFLASLPMVDAKRIGCVGCSMPIARGCSLPYRIESRRVLLSVG